MPRYFADSWYFIARIDPFDAQANAVRRLDARIPRRDLVTHDAVLVEILTFFSGEGAVIRGRAVFTVRSMLTEINVVPGDRQLFLTALDLYARRPDKEYSLADCMSMIVMKDLGLTHVLTNDHHFRQEGFTVVNE